MFRQHRRIITRSLIFTAAMMLFIPAWIYGNALSIFLCLTLCCMLAYYFLWVNEEDKQEKERLVNEQQHLDDKVQAENDRRLRKRITQKITFAGLLTLLYICSVFTLRYFLQPREHQPYFLNTDYHYIYNEGVGFDRKLVLYTNADNPAEPGLWPSPAGTLTAACAQEDKIALQGKNFLQPVFQRIVSPADKDKFVYTPVALPYGADVQQGFTMGNGKTKLTVFALNEKDSSDILHRHRNRTLITGVFHSEDETLLNDYGVNSPYTDTFNFYLKTYIKTGLSFRDLFIRPSSWVSSMPATRQIMSEWIEEDLGNCYLLADYTSVPGTKKFCVFPSATSIAHGYQLFTSGNDPVPLKTDFSATVPYNTRLYVGFAHEENNFMFVADSSRKDAAALIFNRPAYFALSTRMKGKAPCGTSFIRSLRNHYSGFINNPVNEGYLFHEDLRQAGSNSVQGYITVVADAPGLPLQGKVHDGLSGSEPVSLQAGKTFALASGQSGLRWLYNIRDFSQQPFNYKNIFLLLTCLYLLIACALLFFPSRYMMRLEPVLMYMLYAFIFVRCILLWRIATFPPAGDATPNEIENYVAADMFKAGPLSISVTALGLLAFFVIIIAHRIFIRNRKDGERNLSQWRRRLGEPNMLVAAHSVVLIISCAVVAFLGDSFEILVRIFSILVPVTSYLFFCYRLRKNGEQRALVPKFDKWPWLRKPAAFIVRWYDSRETLLSVLTFGALFLMDRGFAIMFLLFLLLKNIAVSFARIPFVLQSNQDGQATENASGKLRDMLIRPRNYWIYGVLAFTVYIIFLVYQGLFHQLLAHKWAVIGGFLVISLVTGLAVLRQNKKRMIWTASHLVIAACIFCFFSLLDGWINNSIKHVTHRASLIYRPVDSIITHSRYNSFEERKILETAESQWFINSYLNKPYDNSRRLNLRPFFDQGVDYTTQTRDIVLPRFVIAEHGAMVMFFLLLLLGIPLILYFVSYRLYDPAAGTKPGVITPRAYAGTLSIILLFTIGLFVWLTATNRFVFFGQDFPFLSLASKISVVLPLILLLTILLGHPVRVKPVAVRMKRKWVPFLFLGIVIAVIVTLLPRPQSAKNFTVKIKQTDSLINGPVDKLLHRAQDSLEEKHNTDRNGHPNLYAAIQFLKQMPEFRSLVASASPYTQSILELLVSQPNAAMQPESPIYLRYDADDNRYFVNFNRNLYLELPAYEGEQEWSGDICEVADTGSSGTVLLNGTLYPAGHLPSVQGNNAVRVALLPPGWFDARTTPMILVSVGNAINKPAAVMHIYPKDGSASRQLDVRAFACEIKDDDLAYVTEGNQGWQLRYDGNAGHVFAKNYYINGRQRLIYPLKERFPWLYQYARTAQAALVADSQFKRNVLLTLDYALTDSLDRLIRNYAATRFATGGEKMPANFRLAVIAADGDGAIHAMTDYVKGRKAVDPNNRKELAAVENDHFFRISSLVDRRQWGNVNLMHMAKGPGSSLKPAVAAAVASGVHVEWTDMQLNDDVGAEITTYAGYDLGRHPWKSTTGLHEFVAHNFVEYLQNSVNLYHSLFLFLGSYPKERFKGSNGQYSLKNLLTESDDHGHNRIPAIYMGGKLWHLPSKSSGQWPVTDPNAPSSASFGNERSLLAQSLAVNYGVFTGEDNKLDRTLAAQSLVDFADTVIYDSMSRKPLPGAVWSFPEQSMFLQAERASSANAMANFSEGLKNPTLGANPWHITPLKMAEMYGRLFTCNAAYSLHITPRPPHTPRPLSIDKETWTADSYRQFLKDYVFLGMEKVLEAGTGKDVFAGSSRCTVNKQTFYCYAKTGTINEAGNKEGSSTRFAIVISKEDLRSTTPPAPHIYTIYITCDKLGGHKYALYRTLIDAVTASPSFHKYMGI